MLMMAFCIVTAKQKRLKCEKYYAKDLANADWKCIRRKRELSTAKMEAGRVIMNIPCSTFWGTHSGDA